MIRIKIRIKKGDNLMLNYRTQIYTSQQLYVDAVVNTIAGFEGHDPTVKVRADGKGGRLGVRP